MKWKCIVCLILTLFLFVNCSNKSVEYEYCKGCVYKSNRIHWGHGFYKLMVYYEFNYDNKKYEGKYKYNKLSRIQFKKFEQGDSVLIKFPKNNITKSTIVGLTYIKNKDYHINITY